MPLAAELELPSFDHTDATLRGDRYRQAMAALRGHDGWLAASPFGFIVLDRDAGEFFLRTKAAVFPGLTIADLFGITDGPLREEIVKNIINFDGDDHRRLRNLVNPALAPRAVDRYRPAMRRFLEQLLAEVPSDGRCEFIADFAKPYPSLVIAEVMGAPLEDAPRLHHWSNVIQRQFDPTSLMAEREQIEQAVAEFYEYEDRFIAARRPAPGDDLISALIKAEEAGDRLSDDELRNLVLNILVGGVDTSQSQLAHAVRLLAEHPDQWAAAARRSARARARRGRGGAPLRADHAVHRAHPDRWRSSTATSRSPPARSCSCRRGTPTATGRRAPTRSTSPPTAAAPGCSRSAPASTTASAPTWPGPRCRRRSRSWPSGCRALALDGEPEFGTPSGIYGLEALPVKLDLA